MVRFLLNDFVNDRHTSYTYYLGLKLFQVFWQQADLCGFIGEQKLKKVEYTTRGYIQMFRLQVQLMFN